MDNDRFEERILWIAEDYRSRAAPSEDAKGAPAEGKWLCPGLPATRSPPTYDCSVPLSYQTHLSPAQASAPHRLPALSKLRGWARHWIHGWTDQGQPLGEQQRVHRQRTETSEPTLRLHRLHARPSAVACELLLLLLQGHNEAPAEG